MYKRYIYTPQNMHLNCYYFPHILDVDSIASTISFMHRVERCQFAVYTSKLLLLPSHIRCGFHCVHDIVYASCRKMSVCRDASHLMSLVHVTSQVQLVTSRQGSVTTSRERRTRLTKLTRQTVLTTTPPREVTEEGTGVREITFRRFDLSRPNRSNICQCVCADI